MVHIQSASDDIRHLRMMILGEEKKETTGWNYNVRICYAGRP